MFWSFRPAQCSARGENSGLNARSKANDQENNEGTVSSYIVTGQGNGSIYGLGEKYFQKIDKFTQVSATIRNFLRTIIKDRVVNLFEKESLRNKGNST